MKMTKDKIDKIFEKKRKEWIIPNVTVTFNCCYEAQEQTINFNKGDLPLLLFYQSLNGSPQFETLDSVERASERYGELLKLGRNPQVYLKLKMKTDDS